jgi:drug/metabolite transporter (DMT)-like permease
MSRPAAVLLLLVSTAIWGFAFVAQKSAMDHMGPMTFGGTRFLLGGLALLPFAWAEHRRKPGAFAAITRRQWWLIALLCPSFFLAAALQQYGLIYTSVTNSGFLTSLYVLFTPLIAWLAVRHRPHPAIYLGAPLALIGIFYLNGGTLTAFNAGDGLMVASAVFWGVQVFLIGLLGRETGLPVILSALSFIVVGLMSLVVAFGFEAPDFSTVADGWIEIAYAGLMSTAVAYTLQAVAQQYVPAANAAVVLSSESLFAALGGALLLGERLTPIGYAGAALIFIAILVVEAVPSLIAARRERQARA